MGERAKAKKIGVFKAKSLHLSSLIAGIQFSYFSPLASNLLLELERKTLPEELDRLKKQSKSGYPVIIFIAICINEFRAVDEGAV